MMITTCLRRYCSPSRQAATIPRTCAVYQRLLSSTTQCSARQRPGLGPTRSSPSTLASPPDSLDNDLEIQAEDWAIAQGESFTDLRQESPSPEPIEPKSTQPPQEPPAAKAIANITNASELVTLQPATLSWHWDTSPPTDAQLALASTPFTPTALSPKKLYSASSFRSVPRSSVPEVAFLGRSNVGKSSTLNAIMGREMCWVSDRPGKTREMNAFGVGGGAHGDDSHQLVVLDMPGYGKGSRESWGAEIMKYLKGRKQYVQPQVLSFDKHNTSQHDIKLITLPSHRLRRAFLLLDPSHGAKPQDIQLLHLFRKAGIPHQIVLCKLDKFLLPPSEQAHIASTNITKKDLRAQRIITPKAKGKEGPAHSGKARTQSLKVQMRKVREYVKVLQELKEKVAQPGNGKGPEALGEIIACSASKGIGIKALRWAIVKAAGIEGTLMAAAEKKKGKGKKAKKEKKTNGVEGEVRQLSIEEQLDALEREIYGEGGSEGR